MGSQHKRRFAALIFGSRMPIMNLDSKQQFVNGLGDNGGLTAIMLNLSCYSSTYQMAPSGYWKWERRASAHWCRSSLCCNGLLRCFIYTVLNCNLWCVESVSPRLKTQIKQRKSTRNETLTNRCWRGGQGVLRAARLGGHDSAVKNP
jgi:hypothetical protein